MTIQKAQKAATAHHEAGHAVVARLLGLDLAFVSLSSEGTGYNAVTQCSNLDDLVRDAQHDLDKLTALAKTDIKLNLAGPVAEMQFESMPFAQQDAMMKSEQWQDDILASIVDAGRISLWQMGVACNWTTKLVPPDDRIWTILYPETRHAYFVDKLAQPKHWTKSGKRKFCETMFQFVGDYWLVIQRGLKQLRSDSYVNRDAATILDRLAKETRVVVTENWRAIQRVAAALLERGRLTQTDVDGLIADGVEVRAAQGAAR